jgi:hypothetical protein
MVKDYYMSLGNINTGGPRFCELEGSNIFEFTEAKCKKKLILYIYS